MQPMTRNRHVALLALYCKTNGLDGQATHAQPSPRVLTAMQPCAR